MSYMGEVMKDRVVLRLDHDVAVYVRKHQKNISAYVRGLIATDITQTKKSVKRKK